jgi:thiamine-phosphate pyrophosphorylase
LSKRGNRADVETAVHAGVSVIQYRDKGSSTRAMYKEALELKKLALSSLFLVNDRLDIALAIGADGVHIGQEDMPYEAARRLLGKGPVIGVTVHSLEEALIAEQDGADYLGVSPIFSTKTKLDAGAPSGTALLAEIKKAVRIPVVAIGGITLSNAADVVAAGADALCAISAVVASEDPFGEIKKFQKLFGENEGERQTI